MWGQMLNVSRNLTRQVASQPPACCTELASVVLLWKEGTKGKECWYLIQPPRGC